VVEKIWDESAEVYRNRVTNVVREGALEATVFDEDELPEPAF